MRSRYKKPGFTTFEMLIVVVIVPMIAFVIWAIYLASMKLWRMTSIQEQIYPPAMAVMGRINTELRSAAAVTVTSSQVSPAPAAMDSVITLSIPTVDGNGYAIIDPMTGFTVDHRVQYYLALGGVNGSKNLWRVTLPATGTTPLAPKHLIAQNLINLTVATAATSEGRVLSLYTTTVTLSAKETGFAYRNVQDKFISKIGFRNDL